MIRMMTRILLALCLFTVLVAGLLYWCVVILGSLITQLP
jgi:hypothetical protein